MEQARGHDSGAQTAAFERYVLPEVDVLLRVARTLVPREADAEDLVQDTLLRAVERLQAFGQRLLEGPAGDSDTGEPAS